MIASCAAQKASSCEHVSPSAAVSFPRAVYGTDACLAPRQRPGRRSRASCRSRGSSPARSLQAKRQARQRTWSSSEDRWLAHYLSPSAPASFAPPTRLSLDAAYGLLEIIINSDTLRLQARLLLLEGLLEELCRQPDLLEGCVERYRPMSRAPASAACRMGTSQKQTIGRTTAG